jgi:hypothetical protein
MEFLCDLANSIFEHNFVNIVFMPNPQVHQLYENLIPNLYVIVNSNCNVDSNCTKMHHRIKLKFTSHIKIAL